MASVVSTKDSRGKCRSNQLLKNAGQAETQLFVPKMTQFPDSSKLWVSLGLPSTPMWGGAALSSVTWHGTILEANVDFGKLELNEERR
jgi:hypothetical protein